jgi:hypothetical protein
MKQTAIGALLAVFLAASASVAQADPIKIRFVGNSDTFGRVDAISDNAANVHEPVAPFDLADPSGANAFESHLAGGAPPGVNELAAPDFGIGAAEAVIVQHVAAADVVVAVVPEPATMTLLFTGLALLGWAMRRRRRPPKPPFPD